MMQDTTQQNMIHNVQHAILKQNYKYISVTQTTTKQTISDVNHHEEAQHNKTLKNQNSLLEYDKYIIVEHINTEQSIHKCKTIQRSTNQHKELKYNTT